MKKNRKIAILADSVDHSAESPTTLSLKQTRFSVGGQILQKDSKELSMLSTNAGPGGDTYDQNSGYYGGESSQQVNISI